MGRFAPLTLLGLLLATLVGSAAPAAPVPPRDLPKLVTDANLILVGTLVAPSRSGDNGRFTRQEVGFLQVETVYKGNWRPGRDLTLQYTAAGTSETDPRIGAMVAGVPRLYFLTYDPTSGARPLSVLYPDFPVRATRPKLPSGVPAKAAVEAELLHNLGGDADGVNAALDALGTNRAALRICHELSWQGPLNVRAQALAYRLEYGEKSAIEPAVRVLEEASAAGVADHAGIVSSGLTALSHSISAEQVRRLVSLKDPITDYVAAQILNLKGSAALAPLAMELVLQTRRPEAQYEALKLLSGMRRAPMPEWPTFRSTRGRFIAETERWWRSRSGTGRSGSRRAVAPHPAPGSPRSAPAGR